MADQKITQLDELTTPTADDLLVVVDDPTGSPVTKKLPISSFFSLGLSNVTVQTLTSATGTYTPTTGMKKCLVFCIGAGGSGANVTVADGASGGGGGGGTAIRLFSKAEVGSSVSYGVGAGVANNNGNNSYFLACSGIGGAVGVSTANTTTLGVTGAGGVGGTPTGGDINVEGGDGGRGIVFSTTNGMGGNGGASMFGGGGLGSGTTANGNAGGFPGGGGGGCASSDDTDHTGGTGADGVIYVIEFLG